MSNTVDIDERIGKCQKILSADPNSQIFAALAEAHRRKGELDKAFRVCQNGLKIHPSYGSAHVVMAKINLDRGLYDWAETEARKAAEIDGWTRATELLLAEIHIYKGEFVKAIKLLSRLHEADPNNPQISRLLDIAQQLPKQQPHVASNSESAPTIIVRSEKRNKTAPVADSNASVEATAAPTPSKPAPEPLTPPRLLKEAVGILGVEGAVLINHEGLILESEWGISDDSAVYGATIGDVVNHVEQELIEACFGSVKSVLIETAQRTLYVIRSSAGIYLFVASAKANLGSLRMKLMDLMSRQVD
ncbi:MAG TPA: tetratricopeptide repeat protein [candidate division Zixibacteria bacterium]|nr:tetratricopeptide repeat protein [candidate division Zixibacteria bacterium]